MITTTTSVGHVINIVKTQRHGYRTMPGNLGVESGDTVTYINTLNEGVTINFPLGNPFDNTQNTSITIPQGGSQPCTVQSSQRGIYTYTVETHESRQYADGDSDPRIELL
jgi:plastocyanin